MRYTLQYMARAFIVFNCTFPVLSSPGAHGERCWEYEAKTRATFSPWLQCQRRSHEVTACRGIDQVSPLVLQLVDFVHYVTDAECTNHVPHSRQNQVDIFATFLLLSTSECIQVKMPTFAARFPVFSLEFGANDSLHSLLLMVTAAVSQELDVFDGP